MIQKNILLLGGSGFVGKHFLKKFKSYKSNIVCLSRKKNFHIAGQKFKFWNGLDEKILKQEITNADIVINLCGEPIIGRPWTKQQRCKLINSRVKISRTIANIIENIENKPELWINASAVGIYPSKPVDNFKNPSNEDAIKADTFIGNLCQAWESSTLLKESNVRVVNARFGVILGKEGGAFKKLYPLFKLGIGHGLGDGRQAFPWIHIDDVINVFEYIIQNQTLKGPVNVVAPESCSVRQFCEVLAKTMNRPFWGMFPAFIPELILGDMIKLVTEGQHVATKKLNRELFMYKTIENAVNHLVNKN